MPLVRSGGGFYNPGPRVVYVLFGPGVAGPRLFSVRLQPGSSFEPSDEQAGRPVSWWEDIGGPTIWERLLADD